MPRMNSWKPRYSPNCKWQWGSSDGKLDLRESNMGLFTSDLYRNFAIGFAIGAIAIVVQIGPDMLADSAAAAIASIFS